MESIEQVKTQLLARKAQLEQEISQLGQNARESEVADVQDEIDQVTSSEAKTASMELSSRQFLSFQNVQEALQRLNDGTYGRCTVCDRPIESARLRAIPETPYCIEHARQLENKEAETDDPDLGSLRG